MSERKLLSVHIERTGGTSLQALLELLVGKENLLLYNPLTDRLTRDSEMKLQRTNHFHDAIRSKVTNTPLQAIINRAYYILMPGFFQSNSIAVADLPTTSYNTIHGHYRADRFDEFIENPLMAVVIRDPLDRMVSLYNHWRRTKGIAERRVIPPFNPTVSFEEFSLSPILQNYQVNALGGKDLSKFNFVGVTEALDLFGVTLANGLYREEFIASVPAGITKMRQISVAPKVNKPPYPPSYVPVFQSFHSDDYLLYKQAESRAL